MSSECRGDDPKCHHCHITSPIPLQELLRTHPLRLRDHVVTETSSSQKPVHVEAIVRGNKSNSGRFSSSRISSSSSSSSEHLSVEIFPDSLVGEELNSSPKIDWKNDTFKKKFARLQPSTSFLHQFAKTTFYKKKFAFPKSSTTVQPRPSSSSLSTVSSSNDFKVSSRRNHALHRLFSPPDKTTSYDADYPTISRYDKNGRKLATYKFRDCQTQTSVTRSFLTRNQPLAASISRVNSIPNHHRVKRRRKNYSNCSLPWSLLIAGYLLLIVIAIVLAVALSQREGRGKNLQRNAVTGENLIRGAPTNLNRNVFNRARSTTQNVGRISNRRPSQRIRISTQGSTRSGRPVPTTRRGQQTFPGPVVVTQFPPPNPFVPIVAATPRPTAAPKSKFPAFQDIDLDYFTNLEFDDSAFILPNQAVPKFSTFPPFRAATTTQAPIRKVVTQPPIFANDARFVARAPLPVPTFTTRQAAPVPPRRGITNNFRQEFNLDQQQQQQQTPRRTNVVQDERPLPVQILKSWSNQNSDGTFSYGYINTDGSFKNETKGTDCVVRGVYGYIDEDTGETLSFPYQAGNPCDPDAPDYFFDYESGTIVNERGRNVQNSARGSSVVSPSATTRRRFVQ